MARSSSNQSRKVAPKSLVRTSHTTQTLDAMFRPIGDRHDGDSSERPTKRERTVDKAKAGGTIAPASMQQAAPRISIPQSETALTSIRDLRTEVIARKNEGELTRSLKSRSSKSLLTPGFTDLDALVKNHVFVGVVGPDQPLSAIQHQQKLLLVNHVSLA